MKLFIFTISLLFVFSCSTSTKVKAISTELTKNYKSTIAKSDWIHGSENCETNKESVFDVYKHDASSFIIRQNKCLTFEAPFSYILVGKQTILVLDTGALSGSPEFSLYAELENIVGKEQFSIKKVLVVHSHSHSDHYEGDIYFNGRSNTKVIETSAKEVRSFFGFTDWPQGEKTIDLGERKITVIPTPGHQEEAISLYDHHTKWLMTGDTLYPGYIYVKDWQAYRNSIEMLTNFTNNNYVIAIMGAHIEKEKSPNRYFPVGTTYQPNEANLDLSVGSLQSLNKELKVTDEPREIIFNDFIIKPMSSFQKMLSNAARWFTQ
jgi:glyoxylase-like metal-dependent hydrolase (beta-lactamase superfamily II)